MLFSTRLLLVVNFVFLLQIHFHYWSLYCSYYLFPSDSFLEYCMFLEIHLFLLGCPMFLHVSIHSIKIVCIFVILVVISPLSLLILFIWVLSLFFKLINFVYVFEKPPQFHWLFYYFFGLYFYLLPLWSLFFSLCWLRALFVLFLVPLGGSPGAYLRFFLFIEEGLFHYKLSS